ncbi:MAG: hypothetical protein AAF718_05145 [Pseudomonadota bacterium]
MTAHHFDDLIQTALVIGLRTEFQAILACCQIAPTEGEDNLRIAFVAGRFHITAEMVAHGVEVVRRLVSFENSEGFHGNDP